jgi:hypothetical protein
MQFSAKKNTQEECFLFDSPVEDVPNDGEFFLNGGRTNFSTSLGDDALVSLISSLLK